jgi:hypothetical protein
MLRAGSAVAQGEPVRPATTEETEERATFERGESERLDAGVPRLLEQGEGEEEEEAAARVRAEPSWRYSMPEQKISPSRSTPVGDRSARQRAHWKWPEFGLMPSSVRSRIQPETEAQDVKRACKCERDDAKERNVSRTLVATMYFARQFWLPSFSFTTISSNSGAGRGTGQELRGGERTERNSGRVSSRSKPLDS